MSSRNELSRNNVLPESFKIMGKQSFPEPALNAFKYWTIIQTKGHQPALVVEGELKNTSELFRVYPRFIEKNRIITDPKSFPGQPRIKELSPSSIKLHYTPLEEIQVDSLYWTPDADVLCGEFILKNSGNKERKITLDLVFHFQSTAESGLSHLEYEGKNLLYGQSKDQHTICFVSGGPSPGTGSLPCLSSNLTLKPDTRIKLRWINIQSISKEVGIEKLDEVILFRWKDELSRENITHQDRLTISTGNADWDLALEYSQCQANNNLTCLETKSSDSNSQVISPLEGLLLSGTLYPLSSKNSQKILGLVFPSEITDKSEHDIGTNKTLSYPEYPFHGELLWQIQQDHDLTVQLDSLLQWIRSRIALWVENKFDRDRDGIPEISSSYFCKRLEGSLSHHTDPDQNICPNPHLESPGLSALLVNEINKLMDLSRSSSLSSAFSSLKEIKVRLIDHINSSWESDLKYYLVRDSDSHLSLESQVLRESFQSGFNIIGYIFPQPSRIVIALSSNITPPHFPGLELIIHGRDQYGEYRIERISPAQIRWDQMKGWAYSQVIYTRLDYIFIQGDDKVNVIVLSPDSIQEDISLLFPLFGKIPDENLAEILIRETITNPEKYWSPYGIRSFPGSGREGIHLPWNYLILQGLLNYGYKTIAADLFSRIMTAMETNFRTTGYLPGRIDSITGKGLDPQLTTEGLIPIRLLMQIAGIEISAQHGLTIKDDYPFSFPLKLKYRGTEIIRDAEKTFISIPGKEPVLHTGTSEFRIQLN